jgi:hypothetical protein
MVGDGPERDPGDWTHLSRLLGEGGMLPPAGSALARLARHCALRTADPEISDGELKTMRLMTEVLDELSERLRAPGR